MPSRISNGRKAVRGSTRPDRAPADPMARLLTAPRPPPGLSLEAAALWRSLARVLVAAGILTVLDLPMLRMLAEALAIEREMAAILRVEGVTIAAGAPGARKGHPAMRAGAEARAVAMRLLGEFGMSPVARQRVDASPVSTDPADAFLKRKWAAVRDLQRGGKE